MTNKVKEEGVKKKFNKEQFFYRVIDTHLLQSLDKWQIEEVKRMCDKFYKKGKKNI